MSQANTTFRAGSSPALSIEDSSTGEVAELADATANPRWNVSASGYRSRLSNRVDSPVESQGVCGTCPFDSGPPLLVASAGRSSKGRTYRMRFSQGLNVQDGDVVSSRNNAALVVG